jgi:hypothetical protein
LLNLWAEHGGASKKKTYAAPWAPPGAPLLEEDLCDFLRAPLRQMEEQAMLGVVVERRLNRLEEPNGAAAVQWEC